MEMPLEERLHRIEKIETEILRKAKTLIQVNSNIYCTDFLILGATKRVLSIASGFRALMIARNFTCCAALLRMQIDTAARVHALALVDDAEALCKTILSGGRLDKQKDREGQFLKDIRLIASLAKQFPWVAEVYKETSAFIHLSERHIFASMAGIDETERTVNFIISAEDPKRKDEDYFEILDAFFEATKMAGTLILGYIYSKAHLHTFTESE